MPDKPDTIEDEFRKALDEYLKTTDHLYSCIGYSEGCACCLDENNGIYGGKGREWVLAFIKKVQQRSYEEGLDKRVIGPMGVSQWREHGKKYGYWKYFEKEVQQRERDRAVEMVKKSNHGHPLKCGFCDVQYGCPANIIKLIKND